MAAEVKAPKMVCPLCGEVYPAGDVYCGKDGTHLESADPNMLSATALSDR